ncbi:MAG TPA: lysylphosphatidylglycerol synthase domain-containing protein [Myxococcota bacterium]|nr:lysylphosphatidylglycerol synthase domain-containing protein [Myxococcota bacterium]
MKNIHTLLLGLGATCLAFLVWEIGPGTLWHDTVTLGWGAALIISVAAIEQLLHTLAWQRCFEPAERPSLMRLYGAHLAGGAINIVTPTATLGGELVRGGLLPGVPGALAAATVTVDRLAYALADTSLGVLGLLVLLKAPSLGGLAHLAIAAAAALFLTGIGIFWALQRNGRLLSRIVGHPIVRRICGPTFAEGLSTGSASVDLRIATFHAERTSALLAAIALHIAGSLMGAVQLGLFFFFVSAPATPFMTIEVFLVGIALDLFSFFIPARLGAQEGARMLAVSLVGLEPALGLLFSLVLRVEQVAWAGIGLGLYSLLVPRGRATRQASRLQTLDLQSGAAEPLPEPGLTPGEEAG